MILYVVLLFSIALQLTAATLAIRLISVSGRRAAWILITAALFLMIVRRLITFAQVTGGTISGDAALPREVTALAISLLLLLGIRFIGAIFDDLRRVKEREQQTQRRLQTLLKNLPGMAYRCYNDRHRTMEFVTESCQHLTGYFADDLTANRKVAYADLIGEADREDVWTGLQEAVRERRPFQLSYRIHTASGKEKWVWEQGHGVFDRSGQLEALEGFIADISERVQTEAALAESERRFRQLFEHMPSAVALHQVIVGQGDTPTDLQFLDVNPAYEKIFALKRDALLGRRVSEVWHPIQVEKPARISDLAQVAVTGQPIRFETHAEQLARWYDVTAYSPARDQVVTVIADMTPYRLAERSCTLLEAAVESAAYSVLITDSRGTIQYVNPAFELTTGYSRSEAIGKTPAILKSGEHSEAFYRHFWSTLSKGDVWQGIFTNRRKDGRLYKEDVTVSPVRGRANEIVNYVAVRHDVTREKELESQLRQAQKMEAIGRLAGGIAHDFNNLLTTIFGYCDFLLLSLDKEDRQYEEALQIQKAAQRAAALTKQLLAFSRKQTLRPVALDLSNSVRQTVKMLHRLIGEDISLQSQLDPHLGTIEADPGQVEQVIMNLAVNARDAMPSGGTLTVETRNVEIDAVHASKSGQIRPGSYVMLAIRDTGHGMDKATLEHIFEPFYTTKGPEKGTGLGLATVFGIVKQSGGHIFVYSEPGQGTVFRIYFPRTGDRVCSVANGVRERRSCGGSESILLVEDEDTVRRLAERILVHHGYAVIDVVSGEEALSVIDQRSLQIDLVLTDMVLSGMNGRELADRLGVVRPGLRVLFMSGYTDDEVMRRRLRSADVPLLQKPFTMESLLDAVREALDKPLTVRQE